VPGCPPARVETHRVYSDGLTATADRARVFGPGELRVDAGPGDQPVWAVVAVARARPDLILCDGLAATAALPAGRLGSSPAARRNMADFFAAAAAVAAAAAGGGAVVAAVTTADAGNRPGNATGGGNRTAPAAATTPAAATKDCSSGVGCVCQSPQREWTAA
jgi:hypothetical protein